jgi:hypothetical protein
MAVATGELIRAMNYVDDITTTLRRICIYIPSMGPEERKRLAEALRGAATASPMLPRSAATEPSSRTCFLTPCAKLKLKSAPISTKLCSWAK